MRTLQKKDIYTVRKTSAETRATRLKGLVIQAATTEQGCEVNDGIQGIWFELHC